MIRGITVRTTEVERARPSPGEGAQVRDVSAKRRKRSPAQGTSPSGVLALDDDDEPEGWRSQRRLTQTAVVSPNTSARTPAHLETARLIDPANVLYQGRGQGARAGSQPLSEISRGGEGNTLRTRMQRVRPMRWGPDSGAASPDVPGPNGRKGRHLPGVGSHRRRGRARRLRATDRSPSNLTGAGLDPARQRKGGSQAGAVRRRTSGQGGSSLLRRLAAEGRGGVRSVEPALLVEGSWTRSPAASRR
jgi:hypothetical protein